MIDTLGLNDSVYNGILLSYNQSITKLTMDKVAVNGAGGWGMNVVVTGEGSFNNVVVKNAAAGGLNNQMAFQVVRGSGNSGW